ncbi:MAG TPA: SDR family oxidoreductase [Aliidongia sp.]|nr:SDR family oxidoreductase [Aliidongia sp.]
MPRLFCCGFGYSALGLARRLHRHGWEIAGTCRDEAKAASLEAEGFAVTRIGEDVKPADLAGITHFLASAPPDAAGDPVLAAYGAALAELRPAWIGYLSTTGVYGDRQGGWVDETSALEPTGERGRRRVAAERAWTALEPAAHLFRLAGIYGPGRSALDTVRSGKAQRVIKLGQVFSRIHVEDIATVLEASIAQPSPGTAYNLCDDDPAPPADVLAYAATLLGVPPPPAVPFEAAELSEMARSFYTDNKRVSNRRIKERLGVTLAYPDYRTGLKAILAAGG